MRIRKLKIAECKQPNWSQPASLSCHCRGANLRTVDGQSVDQTHIAKKETKQMKK